MADYVGPVRTMTGRRQRLESLRRIDRDRVGDRIWLQAEWYRRLLLDFEAIETALKRAARPGRRPARTDVDRFLGQTLAAAHGLPDSSRGLILDLLRLLEAAIQAQRAEEQAHAR